MISSLVTYANQTPFINHMLVLAKQYIYECRNKFTYPSFTIFLNKVVYVHQLEKKLPFNVLIDTKSREFQYRNL